MESLAELNNLSCQREKHNDSPLVGFCIDENCKEENKFACLDCIFENHPQHKLVKMKELKEFIEKRFKDYEKKAEEEKELNEIYLKNEEILFKKLDQLKKEINKAIEVKIIDFKKDLLKEYYNLKNINNKINFSALKEFQEMFSNNAAPTMKPELVHLSKICNNLLKEANSKEALLETKKGENKKKETDDGNNNSSKDIKKKIEDPNLSKFNEKFDEFIKNQLSSINKYINENFLVSSIDLKIKSNNFEWCYQTYSGYDFFYELSDNKLKGTKISSNGTMTILRAKEELKENYIYNIKFKIGLKNGGDFDVGIGTDKVGDSCWLRTKESLCISNKGIINLDMVMDNITTLKDNDVLDIEIKTGVKERYLKAILNNTLICHLDFELKNVFIMAAIRNIGNFIEVLEYNESENFI